MLDLPFSEILKLTVLGSVVTVAGSLIALYIKEVLTVRSFERWKARQTLITVYRRYQLPLFLAAEELSNRVFGLSRPDNDREPREVGIDLLKAEIQRAPHGMVSEHYFQYRFVSNVYRLCSFLGWVELYRRDIGTLDVDALDRNHRLEACLENIRSPLADGWINQHPDNDAWRDCLIFREELRAIGHRMALDSNGLGVIDFGSFFEILRKDPTGIGEARWFLQAALLYDTLARRKDFRIVRMRMLYIFLADLMEVLQPGRNQPSHIATALNWFDTLEEVTGGPKWMRKESDMPAVRRRLAGAI